MPLINCEIKIFLTWSEKCIITTRNDGNQEPKFTITDIKLYIPVVTLSTQDNEKLLRQLKTCFQRTINWNKYQSEPARDRYLNYLNDPNFQGVIDFLFYHLKMIHIEEVTRDIFSCDCRNKKEYNVLIDGKIFLINQ